MKKLREMLEGENALIGLAILPSAVWLVQLALLRLVHSRRAKGEDVMGNRVFSGLLSMWQLTNEQHERFLRLIKLEIALENELKFVDGRIASFGRRTVPVTDGYTLGRLAELKAASAVLHSHLAEARGEVETV